jgi:phospholipid-transporting ATPase
LRSIISIVSRNTDFKNILEKFETWEILATLPFDSERKRMSIVVKSKLGEIYLFSKGADEVIFSKLQSSTAALINTDCDESFDDIKFSTHKNIHDIHCPYLAKAKEINENFAKQGYRTLILGKKKISAEYFNTWFHTYNNILNDINIPQAHKHNKMNEMFDLIEDGMTYIGCSAIEDKLQDGVEETIKVLRMADIKIWILTGDKIENSIEIAKSCNLTQNENLVYFTLKNIKKFEEFNKKINNFETEKQNFYTENSEYCLILDGKTLSYYEMLNEKDKKLFSKIMTECSSAICCRLTPKQKSKITKILKNGADKITLSVGDGANDVPMILEANIGIGISGMEGTQAVRSADYSISQFKFLRELILYHGRLSYKRMSNYTCYAFYKNIIVVFTEIYFIIFNGFSGQIFFSDWFTNFYNTFWSSWPMIINYSMDRDIDRNLTLKYPFIYKAGPKSYYMNKKIFWGWILCAMFHGAIIFWIPMIVREND